MKLHKLILSLRAIPKTIYFNLHYLPLSQALHFPVIVSHRVVLQEMKGKIAIEGPVHFNKIRLGFHENPGYDHSRVRAVWSNKGTVVFQGTAYLGNGTRLRNNGVLTLGHNFQVSGNSFLHCREKMTFGKNVTIGWECVFMDGDGHRIFSMESRQRPGGGAQWQPARGRG